MKILLIILLTLIGCGWNPWRRHESRDTVSPLEQLEDRRALYRDLAADPWVNYRSGCDGLLFASLAATGQNQEFDIELARAPDPTSSPFLWYRNPTQADCSSDISRDMYLGLFEYILHFRRPDLAEEIWAWGQDHDWKMGRDEHADTRTVLSPNLIGLLARVIDHLGGRQHAERDLPATFLVTTPGFESHLTLLQIHMEGLLAGSISDYQLQKIQEILAHSPSNPLALAILHRYTDGDQTAATVLLLSIWPGERLPTSADWCEEWRTQRADGDSNFQPCPTENRQHSGGDFLFVAGIILEGA